MTKQNRAQAQRTDEYFEANLAWLDLDANIDVSIGPHETYDDQLTGQKAFYKANVLIVDRPAAQKLAALMDAVPAIQARLPVTVAFRPDQTGGCPIWRQACLGSSRRQPAPRSREASH